jgi:hypothetical protein
MDSLLVTYAMLYIGDTSSLFSINHKVHNRTDKPTTCHIHELAIYFSPVRLIYLFIYLYVVYLATPFQ